MSTAKEGLKMAAVAIDSLEVIQGLTQVGGPGMAAALQAINKVIAAVREGLDGKTSPEIVEDNIKSLTAALSDHDAAADEIVRRRIEAAKGDKP